MRKIFKALYAKKQNFGFILIAVVIFFFIILLPDLTRNPKQGTMLLMAPFKFWVSYLIMAISALAGYANGLHEKKNEITSILASLIILFLMVFGLSALYHSLECKNSDLIILVTYLIYSVTRVITTSWPEETELKN